MIRDANDLKQTGILKYYRLVRKWACKTYGLTDAELELLIYLTHEDRFNRQDFKDGTYIHTWDKTRWDKLRSNGWIEVWRHRNRTTIKYSIYKVSFKCNHLVSRIYRILMGEEDIPTHEKSVFYKNETYTDKVFNKAIDDMINDKER